jgi:replicative superfamily II helicase
MNLQELESRGIPAELLACWEAAGYQTLTPVQEAVFNHEPLWQGRNVLVVAPTSAGKTFVGEVLAATAGYNMHRAIYLAPFKAIAEERFIEFRDRYSRVGIPVAISDGDHAAFDQELRRGFVGIAIIVYEKLAQLLVHSPGILSDCRVCVVDEIQLIGDAQRGPGLELLLTQLRMLPSPPQLVGLSATLGDLGGFDTWLDADAILSEQRPVPLLEGVATLEELSPLVNRESGERCASPDIRKIAVPQEIGSRAVLQTAYRILQTEGLDKQFLIFETRVDSTISTARSLAEVLPTQPVDASVRRSIADLEPTPVREFLEQWIDRRVAYHNAGLSLEERRLVERLFREEIVRILVSTSTLAAGVNTPADVVIIADHMRWNGELRTSLPVPVDEYRNCAGRAGRFGITKQGRAYIIAGETEKVRALERTYLAGIPGSLRSAIPGMRDPSQLILGIVARGQARSHSEVQDVLANSFAPVSHFKSEAKRQAFLEDILQGVDRLLNSELLGRKESGELVVTKLGRVAAGSGVTVPTFEQLSGIVCRGALSESMLLDAFERLAAFSECQVRPYDPAVRAAVLREWIDGNTITKISERHSDRYAIGSGHVRTLGATFSWLIGTMNQICRVIRPADHEAARVCEAVATRCLHGVPHNGVALAELEILNRSEVIRLLRNKHGKVFDSPHLILDTADNEFVGILPAHRVRILKESILRGIGESLRRRRAAHLVRADKFTGLRPLLKNVYDSSGEEFEEAVRELLNSEPLQLAVSRFTSQPTGQPDLEFAGRKGTIVMQVTASQDDRKPVAWAKAREVLSSVGYSGRASNFATIGRPKFHEVAVRNARELADRGDQHLLLIPLVELVELILREREGAIESGSLARILEEARGFFTVD